MIRGTPKDLLPVNPQNANADHIPSGPFGARWHKQTGIRHEPISEEITAPGLQKCIVWDYGTHLEIKRLLVMAECQGAGVGTKVLSKLKERGKKIVLFPVSDEGRQEDLEKFYRRNGFRPDFYDRETFLWEP